jgi:endonuclease/exonuclease/phosphatase family metal-dependent hydrolase
LPALFALIALVTSGCGQPPRATLRVATLNLAHGRGLAPLQSGLPRETLEENLTKVASALRRESPDVIALQEVDAPSKWSGGFDHLAFLADAAGYPHRYHGLHVDLGRAGLEVHYGTALLAHREPGNTRNCAFREEPFDTKGYVQADIAFAGRRVTVVSVHLDFKSARTRRKQIGVLIERLRQHQTPLVVMGDFNATWNRPNDAVRLLSTGLNLRPYQAESEQRNTFPSRHPRRRLDWILISDKLEFVDQWCWPDELSDHLGVTAELAWRSD